MVRKKNVKPPRPLKDDENESHPVPGKTILPKKRRNPTQPTLVRPTRNPTTRYYHPLRFQRFNCVPSVHTCLLYPTCFTYGGVGRTVPRWRLSDEKPCCYVMFHDDRGNETIITWIRIKRAFSFRECFETEAVVSHTLY